MSTLRERLDALVFDLTDKAYDKIGQASEFAEDTIEAVFDVVDEVTARAEELKAQAGSRSDDKVKQAARDFWKGFTDEVKRQTEQTAPEAEESVEDKAKKAYEYLVENDSAWGTHRGMGYWDKYYRRDAGGLGDDVFYTSIIATAESVKNGTPRPYGF